VMLLTGISRDAEFAGPLDSDIVWIHRRAGNADIYFVANRTDREQDVLARFRVDGKEAELWHPDTGRMEAASYTLENGRTIVPLNLKQRESMFVVFRRAPALPSRTIAAMRARTFETLKGPWEVSFPAGLGAPERIRLETLESWTKSSEEGVKFFSGTATYTRTVQIPAQWLKGNARLVLDLGSVKDIAQVAMNGQALATLWKPPYQVDITGVAKSGMNRIEIKVTNQWTNRQAGDRLVAPEKKVLAASSGGMGGFGGAPALSDAGLLGPVVIGGLTTIIVKNAAESSNQEASGRP